MLDKLEYLGIDKDSKVYKTLYDIFTFIDDADLSEEDSREVFQLISEAGMSEIDNIPHIESWGEFDYGNTIIGDLVRVHPEAYDTESGHKHNGRVGFILSISGRRCLVRYAGTRGKANMRHPIEKLQSPRRGVK